MHENKICFHNNETPQKDTDYSCSALIRIESVCFRLEENKYYPQVFLEECKYRLDNGRLRIDASDESDNVPDSEEEFNSEYESDTESEKSSKKSKNASK